MSKHTRFLILSWLLLALCGGKPMLRAGADGSDKDAAEEKRQKMLADNVARAPVVVEGAVTKVRPIPEERMAAANGDEKPITEHDPELREAVVTVASVLKGTVTGEGTKKVVVLFSNSRDPYNRDRPKLKEGEKGIFILHKNEIKDERARAVLLTKTNEHEGDIYTALEPTDFVREDPKHDPTGERLKAVRNLIKENK